MNKEEIAENIRLGGSDDYAKGYQQALKDCAEKAKIRGAQ